MKRYSVLFTFIFAALSVEIHTQLEYIGLKEKSDVREAQVLIWDKYGSGYHPNLQIINNYIYATTNCV